MRFSVTSYTKHTVDVFLSGHPGKLFLKGDIDLSTFQSPLILEELQDNATVLDTNKPRWKGGGNKDTN